MCAGIRPLSGFKSRLLSRAVRRRRNRWNKRCEAQIGAYLSRFIPIRTWSSQPSRSASSRQQQSKPNEPEFGACAPTTRHLLHLISSARSKAPIATGEEIIHTYGMEPPNGRQMPTQSRMCAIQFVILMTDVDEAYHTKKSKTISPARWLLTPASVGHCLLPELPLFVSDS